MKTHTPHNAGELRRQAEDRLSEKQASGIEGKSATGSEETAHALHELQVHQIELEMQNEELRKAQIQIEAARERYFDLYEMAPVGYCSLSGQGRILEANLTAATLLGVTRSALVKQPISRFILKDDQDIYYLHSKKLLETGDPQECELRLLKPDGSAFWAHLAGNVAQAEDGTPVHRMVISDITGRKQEATYREMWREILQILNAPDDDLHKCIPRVLTAFKTRIGIDAVGLRLQADEDFPYFDQDGFPKDFLLTENTLVERDKDGCVCRDKDGNVSLECTCGLVISGKTDPSCPLFSQTGSCWTNNSYPLLDTPADQDLRLNPRNNCIHHGYASVALIPIRIKDRIVGLIQLNDKRKDRFSPEIIQILEGIALHIGSALMRKQAERELRLLSTAIAQSPETVVITDTEGNIQYVNPAFETTTGYTCEEVKGKNPRILKSGQQDAVFYAAMWNTLLEGRVWEGRMTNKRKDDSFYTEEASIAPVKDRNGTIINFVAVKNDITKVLEQEHRFRENQKMESVGRLAGGVAHEFNNTLMGIMGFANMCREEIGEGHPIIEWLDEIINGAARSAKLTRQLLAFARKQTIAPKVLDLNETVTDMLRMLHLLIGENIDLSWLLGTALWSVKLDPSQLDQILTNLCVNARDAISGVGKITIKTRNVSIDADYCSEHAEALMGDHVMLAISDDGSGMDRETLENIFEPFFTTKGVGEGSGLGLATVYGIVKQNNGFVNAESEPGNGSTIRIFLPRFVNEQLAREAAVITVERPRGSETVMLVEDEKIVLSVTARFLKQLGYTVLTAETPAAALRLAAGHEGEIELLITDVVMPGMNGCELAAELSRQYPHLKCLFISGYTADIIDPQGILGEGVHFLAKPFSRDNIAHTVYEILKGKPTAMQLDKEVQ